jgi:hypothetical protein
MEELSSTLGLVDWVWPWDYIVCNNQRG